MRKSRKVLFNISGVLTLLTSVLLGVSFVFLLFNINGARTMLEDGILYLMQGESINLTSAINFTLIYSLVSAIANWVFGIRYFKYAKLSYPVFLASKRQINKTMVLNLLTSVWLYPVVFAIFAVSLNETKSETAEFNITFAEQKRQQYFRQVVSKDQRLFAMTVKINVLKHQLKNKEISEEDYKKLLNDIITTGVSV